ncbi:MAG: MerR family transcriptional regulator [Bacteroidales bacterium]|jgi:DNA-binding transcriptional MerR regulator|nr:MerR family transcriptional regulator [Bacteroidales bacterium]MBR4487958.1 MerR family transcriptional regulator [Bacteroidales bacterium]
MQLDKPYYSISETAQMFNVNTSLLRYWEKEFTQIKPYKNKKGDRYFTPKDIEIIQIIYNLTKIQGYTLQGAKDELKRAYGKHASQAQAVATLREIREKLIAIRDSL